MRAGRLALERAWRRAERGRIREPIRQVKADQKGPWPLPRREGSLWIPTRRERGLADVALGGPASLD